MGNFKYGCSCCDETTQRSAVLSRHGTLEDFEAAVNAAVPEFISYSEASAAAERYRLLLAKSPE